MIRRPPRSTRDRSSAASDVYKGQGLAGETAERKVFPHRHACEQAATLRHVTDTGPRDIRRVDAGDIAAFIPHPAGSQRHQPRDRLQPVSFSHLRDHQTVLDLVFRLLLAKKTT